MEYFQHIQNRTGETVAVIDLHASGMQVGALKSTDLLTRANALTDLAQTRDDSLADYDEAVNAEHLGYFGIRTLTYSLPRLAEGDLDDDDETEAGLLDLLDPAYAVVPRTTEAAIKRGQKIVSAITRIDTHMVAKAMTPIKSAGKGVGDLAAALAAQPALEQTVEDKLAGASDARRDLRVEATAVDRLNKRFYKKLESEAISNPALKAALSQINTGPSGPHTLGIKKVMQGGADQRQVLVSYDNGSFTPGAVNTLEWMVVGVDADFTSHSMAADPSGNTLGPFTVGQTIKLRTRVVLAGTTTGSTRTITIAAA